MQTFYAVYFTFGAPYKSLPFLSKQLTEAHSAQESWKYLLQVGKVEGLVFK